VPEWKRDFWAGQVLSQAADVIAALSRTDEGAFAFLVTFFAEESKLGEGFGTPTPFGLQKSSGSRMLAKTNGSLAIQSSAKLLCYQKPH
jgi:hypothetical protein